MKNTILFLFSIILVSCSSDDSSSTDDDGGSSGLTGSYITAKVNGNDFEAVPNDNGVPVISAALVEADLLFSLTVSGIDFGETISQGEAIAIALIGSDFDDVVNGLEVVNPVSDSSSFQFVGGYEISSTGGNGFDSDFDESTGFLRITSIDKDSRTFSGQFEFTVTETNTNTTYQITEGVFNDIVYEVQ